jgi:hypothetical protein
MKEVREYFDLNYGYVNLVEINDHVLESFLSQSYLTGLSFMRKMDCLYDYILSQGLCDVEE